jgi:Flp pilus assembly protein TadG
MRQHQLGLAASRRLAPALRTIAHDGRGNFAVMFALSAPVLIVLLGLGLDYLSGLSFKTRWDTAADAAALASVQSAEAYVKANASIVTGPALVTNAEAAGVAAGLKAFHANAGASAATEAVTPTVAVSQSGTRFTGTAAYSGAMGTHFGGLVGVSSLAISGTSVA